MKEVIDKVNTSMSPREIFHHFSLPAFDKTCGPILEEGKLIKSIKTLVEPGVVLLSRLNPDIERVCLVDVAEGDKAVASTEFIVMEPRLRSSRYYIYCLARSTPFRQRFVSLVTGTSKESSEGAARGALALDTVCPPSDVVAAFDRLVSGVLDRAMMCRQQTRVLASIRDALLPRLVSGQVRVG